MKNGANTNFIQLDQDKKFEFATKQIGGLIQAPTGQGKTRFLFYLILSCAELGSDLYFIDGKRSDLFGLRFVFSNDIRDKHIASTPSEACRLLRELTERMNLRYAKYFSSEDSLLGETYTSYKLRPVFVFFDEVIATLGEDKKIAKEIESYLIQIMLKGRQAGIFVILSSQRFSADILSTTIRENVGMRVVLGKMSKDSYRMALGDFYDELPAAKTGIGMGYIYLDGLGWTTPRAFQTPILDTNRLDIKAILKRLLDDANKRFNSNSD